ncbi:phenylacetic acid degradation bifunctional protein PaaZ [Flavihumibacter petaseus]|uniref:3-oxo-5,6-dehydrosuberyl-CoA semialdehyde dehydrogenase/oxepin-CoA hydrolase n=1 Tax=Flavihumibacter petaseus NBRC 106054 TaxID=1220578 RepID=A0A0E9MY40_9BACT|nr:phenylacetic acid degradation bifunctional protein PaaZ [Flavihumibacter petaseus]GAO42408.1 3-oxo-5,6-dehydrosuberyl-CoA semialdehyde dehydrogenase/oxepin-CoA hydrolase [Flavihumibacter petaseus NBRC 106054]
MRSLENYVTGRWVKGDGDGQTLYHAVNGTPIFTASTAGLDWEAIVRFARETGNPALRRLTFHERGRMLRALALHLQQFLPEFYEVSLMTGATRGDSWIDLEGGIGNLFSYASLRRKFPDTPYCIDGDSHNLSKQNSFMGTHLLVPKEGVAIHINAFNFPVWGMLEKVAVNWLAGMPAIVKPATVTSYLTEVVARKITESGILPHGAFQLVCGSAGNLLDHAGPQDVITFTGSATTGKKLKTHPSIINNSVPFNMEADSLNAIVLGNTVEPGDPEWDIFIREVKREMTVKAGQKCTAIRRILVPAGKLEKAQADLSAALGQTIIGNPANEKVRMGALAGQDQRREVREQVSKLLAASRIIYGSLDSVSVLDADPEKGAFLSPLLLLNEQPHQQFGSHEIEAFGPVSTLMPYDGPEDAVTLAAMGKGSLCSTIVTSSPAEARDFVVGAGPWHGRILVLDRKSAKESTGHGSPLPLLVHGGPGRAGGGEEMGGIRGVRHYMQRLAVQGSPEMITAITQVYQPNAEGVQDPVHPFRKYFEELEIGHQILTGKRTITEADIVQFANLSWDHFYAHTDHTALEGTLFEKPVAHGYLILSAAAGLFVDSSAKGPVMLNYGLDELRFLQPVYAGTTIQVRFTCKEKIAQDQRSDTDLPRGIVKWLVEVLDNNKEPFAIATILTMVQKKLLTNE